MHTVSSTTVSETTANAGSNLTLSTKYGGLIDIPLRKRFRNLLFVFIAYIDSLIKSHEWIHVFMTGARLVQLIGPALGAGLRGFWPKGPIHTAVGIVSVFYHILPPDYRDEGAVYLLLVYSISGIMYMSFVVGSALYFKEKSQLHSVVAQIIDVTQSTFGFWLQPIGGSMCGEIVSMWIEQRKVPDVTLYAVALALSVVVLIAFMWYMSNVAGVGVLFKPCSLATVQARNQIVLLVMTTMISFVSSLASHLSKIPRIIVLVVTLAMYVYVFVEPLIASDYVSFTVAKLEVGLSLAGIIYTLVVIIATAIGKNGSEALFIVYIAVVAVGLGCGHFIMTCVRNRALIHLDLIEDDEENYDVFIRKPKYAITHAIYGFQVAHPICLSWKLFLFGVERWPQSVPLWMVFAKFCAIYPEENGRLEWIRKAMVSRKLSGALAKLTLEQIRTIQGRRENNLSPALKRKLNHITKSVSNAKHKLQGIWDLVIQGNITEMELSIKKGYIAVEKCDKEFRQVMTQYPNNRFVARSYGRYLREVKADHMKYNEWKEKIYLLQRGIQVEADLAHELGEAAFTNLPQSIDTLPSKNTTNTIGQDSEIMTATETDVDEDPTANVQCEQAQNIRTRIEALRIPSHTLMCSVTLFVVFGLIAAPCIATLCYLTIFTNDFVTPLTFIYNAGFLRSLTYQTCALALHYVMEHLPWIYNDDMSLGEFFVPPPDLAGYVPGAFEGETTTAGQLRVSLSKIPIALEGVADLRGYMPDSVSLDEARNMMFQSVIDYKFHVNASYWVTDKLSLEDIMMEIHVLFTDLLEMEPVDKSTLQSPNFLNPINNCESVGTDLSLTIELLSGYLSEIDRTLKKYVLILEIVAPCFLVIFSIAGVSYLTRLMKRQRILIYECLTILPKNVVSQVSENLRLLKKEDGTRSTEMDSELSKQEENILKVFAAAHDSSNVNSGRTVFIGACIVISAIGVICYVLICNAYATGMNLLLQSYPHLETLTAANGYMQAAFVTFWSIAMPLFGYKEVDPDPRVLLARYYNRFDRMAKGFETARYGDGDTVKPFNGFYKGLENAAEAMDCEDRYKVPSGIYEVTQCMSSNEQYSWTETMFLRTIWPYDVENMVTFEPRSKELGRWWVVGTVLLYDSFFQPMYGDIVGQVSQDMKAENSTITIIVAILLIVTVCVAAFIIVFLRAMEKYLKFCLEMLLQCPINVVMQIKKIALILSGDFSQKSELATRNEEFFDQVVENLMDGIIVADSEYKITVVNRAALRVLEREADTVIGTDVRELLKSDRFEIDCTDFDILENQKQVQTDAEGRYRSENGTYVYLQFTMVSVQRKMIVTMRDQTQIVNHNKLISEERQKSDRLLGSILPPSLVPRVQAGEQNISFAVQSASVSFIDIVEFTPWCASNTAAKVMATLNKLFKAFDARVAMRSTLTKIKCIGDCYMCAGGIFSDVNQPAVHATEMIEFGLDAIQAVTDLDEETGEKLRIRVGVNTGGPIVAGVLGIGKPTFEILGPAINMAQQMEHHGVPMQVHISRPVYELTYGGGFVVKERGQIEVKNGPVMTYLITGRKAQRT